MFTTKKRARQQVVLRLSRCLDTLTHLQLEVARARPIYPFMSTTYQAHCAMHFDTLGESAWEVVSNLWREVF